MRKIDKSKILSTTYKTWEEALEKSETPHPKYSHTKTREAYSLDIVMNLIHCQNGICAYTEMSLCNPKYYSTDNWEDGKYASKKPEKFGQLEHFDENLKSKKDEAGKKDWLWDNFFMVHSDINTVVKRSNSVHPILKPDTKKYDPFYLMKYNLSTHYFLPNDENLSADEQASVQYMINTLGINFDIVVNKRKKHLLMNSKNLEFANLTGYEEPEPKEFITAHEMIKRNPQNLNTLNTPNP